MKGVEPLTIKKISHFKNNLKNNIRNMVQDFLSIEDHLQINEMILVYENPISVEVLHHLQPSLLLICFWINTIKLKMTSFNGY